MSTITAPTVSKTTAASPFLASPVKRKTMSITQTYFLAHKARAKLSSQAARPDHNLRLLVGHANLLDTLMLELADAEREQESWFNQSVRVASPAAQQSPAAAAQAAAAQAAAHKTDRHVQWADSIAEEDESEDDWEADDSDVSDSSSDYTEEDEDEEDSESSLNDDDDVYDEDCEMADVTPLRRMASHNANANAFLSTSSSSSSTTSSTSTIAIEVTEADDESDAEVDDAEEDYTQLTLTRSPSHSASSSLPSPTSPPELVMEDSDVSEDEAMPPSPPVLSLESFPKPNVPAKQPTAKFDDGDRVYLPPRNPARVVSSVSVY